jgi:hypothetical protein
MAGTLYTTAIATSQTPWKIAASIDQNTILPPFSDSLRDFATRS